MDEDSDQIQQPLLEKAQEDLPINEPSEQLTEEQQKKLYVKYNDTINRFKQLKKDEECCFLIESPIIKEIQAVALLWSHRPVKTEKILLRLELKNCQLSLPHLVKYLEAIPSIMLYVNGEKHESKGILKSDNQYFYEGTEKFMAISTDETEYIGEVLNFKYHGNGELVGKVKKSEFRYTGQFFEGKMHGEGQHQTKKVKYIGGFKDDYRHGKGVETIVKKKKNPTTGQILLIQKSLYDGEWDHGYRSGNGTEETPHSTYTGNWTQNVKCGNGEMRYKNGDSYAGEWENNEFNGEGQYCEKGNCIYKGQFKNGKYHGKGVMEYENGDRFQGDYEEGKKHGNGVYTWCDGDYYDGEWKKDSAQGHGTSMIGTDFYDGEFKNGRRHGEGELTNEDGDTIRAIWQNNVITKEIERNGERVD